ncbi:MAG: acyl-CoA dehydratase activase [Candidatus Alcyoniella australis]|nr:acyl-CoA dehydratase activase [Candidatus Alcyoniella australis]
MTELYAGIDIGSLTTKCTLIDPEGRIVAWDLRPTAPNASKAAQGTLTAVCAAAKIEQGDLSLLVSTGYGRNRLPFEAKSITEITCHAKGAARLVSGARTVIDIGGQDSKAIRIDELGKVGDFVMNDKCAAGTGRFLEVMARTLEVDLDQVGPLALEARSRIAVSSMCTVFAESEVVGLIANGHPTPDILAGICRSVADRVAAMAARIGVTPAVVMTGGVARNAGVVLALSEKLGHEVTPAPHAQLAGAYGAALFSMERNRSIND